MPLRKIKSILDYEKKNKVLNLYEKVIYLTMLSIRALHSSIKKNIVLDWETRELLEYYTYGKGIKYFERKIISPSLFDLLNFDLGEYDEKLTNDILKIEKLLYEIDKKKYLNFLKVIHEALPFNIPDEYLDNKKNIKK